jgi:RNA polymerase sigma-70 factor (ECF subfamily)
MATSLLNPVIRQLRRAVLLPDGAGLTDGQLLESFVSQRDEAAFGVLVRRHGPMVLGVCRRVLRNHHDAEDAFQATFLVLVRKAASIVPREMVANWLYGVAHRTALKARSMIAKQRVRERQVTAMPEPEALEPEDCWREWQPLLDQELSRLPDKYRVPVVLCDLEGKTGKEAARQLAWPEGTVSSRLARGRTMLAKRLTRHGLALSGGSLAVALSENASACVPASVVSATVKAASLFVAGKAAATGAISARAAALTEAVVKTMLLTKLKVMAGVVLVVGILGTGLGLGTLSYRTEAAGSGTATREAAPKSDRDRLQGTWQQVSCKGKDEVPDDLVKKTALAVKDDTITVLMDGVFSFELTFKLDESKTPKTIDEALVKPEKGTRPYLGIYSLDGDTLKFCFSDPGEKRPTEFTGRVGSGWTLTVFKRKQPSPARPAQPKAEQPTKNDTNEEKPTNRSQAKQVLDMVLKGFQAYQDAKGGRAQLEDLAKKDVEKLQGTWRVVSSQVGDEKAPEDEVARRKVKVEGDKLIYDYGNERKEKQEGTIKLDPKTKALDWTWTVEGKPVATMLGIYELKGEGLTIAFGELVRPRRLETGKDDVVWLLVLKREKP